MLITVTGAAGFIGSHVAEAAAGAGHEVIAVDAIERSMAPDTARANWAALGEHNITLLEADLATDDLAKLTEVDVIIHLAGRPGVRTSWGEGAKAAERDNPLATGRLLAACLGQPRGRRPRVVVASTSSVYGTAGERAQAEDDALRPMSPYAVSKVEVERRTVQAVRDGLDAVILRYFSVYGPRQRPDMAFHRFIEAAIDGRPLQVLGDGRQSRSFTHVRDVVAATLAAVDTAVPPGTVLNVGSPEPTELRTAVDVLADLLGVRPRLCHQGAAAGDVSRTWADITRTERLLGWSPKIGLIEGLADQISWHRSMRIGIG